MGSNHKKVFSSVQLLSRVWLWRPHRQQLTRLPHPWDSPGKNTGVGCHFLQCMKVKSESEVSQLCPTLCDPMDCSLPGSSTHGLFQARVLEWVAVAFSEPTAGLLLRISKGLYQMTQPLKFSEASLPTEKARITIWDHIRYLGWEEFKIDRMEIIHSWIRSSG